LFGLICGNYSRSKSIAVAVGLAIGTGLGVIFDFSINKK
jgi:hypothetical protein